jgi:excisionase family DNA binding protein
MTSNSKPEPLLIDKQTAAEILSLCVRTIDNLIATRQLPCRRIGRRTLIPYRAVLRFARRDHARTVPATAAEGFAESKRRVTAAQ